MVEVTGPDGLRGRIDTAQWPLDGSRTEVLVELSDGRHLMVPLGLLRREADGSCHLPLVADQLAAHERKGVEASVGIADAQVAVPVVQEQLIVGKRVEEAGRVRIRKVIREEEQVVDEPLTREEVTVERRAVQRVAEGPQNPRTEGDATIIPVVREVLVIEKRLMVTEELVVRKRIVEDHQPQTVTVRREEAVVERLGPRGTPEVADTKEQRAEESSRSGGKTTGGGTKVARTKSRKH